MQQLGQADWQVTVAALVQGFDVDARCGLPGAETALCLAVKGRLARVVPELLRQGARLFDQSDGAQPLENALRVAWAQLRRLESRDSSLCAAGGARRHPGRTAGRARTVAGEVQLCVEFEQRLVEGFTRSWLEDTARVDADGVDPAEGVAIAARLCAGLAWANGVDLFERNERRVDELERKLASSALARVPAIVADQLGEIAAAVRDCDSVEDLVAAYPQQRRGKRRRSRPSAPVRRPAGEPGAATPALAQAAAGFVCGVCGTRFDKQRGLDTHMGRMHGSRVAHSPAVTPPGLPTMRLLRPMQPVAPPPVPPMPLVQPVWPVAPPPMPQVQLLQPVAPSPMPPVQPVQPGRVVGAVRVLKPPP